MFNDVLEILVAHDFVVPYVQCASIQIIKAQSEEIKELVRKGKEHRRGQASQD